MKFILLLLTLIASLDSLIASEPRIAAYFSPDSGPRDTICQMLQGAKKSIEIAADSFTDPVLADALIQAKKRGVNVRVILDKHETSGLYSQAFFLTHKNIPVFLDSHDQRFRDRFMVIDGTTVVTGSYSFTFDDPQRDADNLVIISNAPDLSRKFDTAWQRHLHNSTQLSAKKAVH